MKLSTIVSIVCAAVLSGSALVALAQDTPPPADDEAATTTEPVAEALEWSDYTVKAYSLTVWGGTSSGATYLDNPPIDGLTVLTDGAADILAYDGGVLPESRDIRHYDAATKEIKSGDAFGGRIGIYLSNDFHLDLMGSYASGEAVTSMLYTEEPDLAPDKTVRVQVDSDPGFKTYKGGLALMYNATPAAVFGAIPRLGFGLGGIINRYSQLPDKTALYLEANFGLTYEVVDNVSLGAQADITNFAFEVDELGYSNMTTYTTFSLGVSWFIDRVPEPVRASHEAKHK